MTVPSHPAPVPPRQNPEVSKKQQRPGFGVELSTAEDELEPSPRRHQAARKPVFAIGTLGLEVLDASRERSLGQLTGDGTVDDNFDLLSTLIDHPHAAEHVEWTLDIEGRPMYAIEPGGAFGAETYARLLRLLLEQEGGHIERICLPGWLTGEFLHLPSGPKVPVVRPVLRGLFGWSTARLVETLVERRGLLEPAAQAHRDALTQIMESTYRGHPTAGLEPVHRALNYAVTNPSLIDQGIVEAQHRGLRFSDLRCEEPAPEPDGGNSPRPRPTTTPVARITLRFKDCEGGDESLLWPIHVDVGDVLPVLLPAPLEVEGGDKAEGGGSAKGAAAADWNRPPLRMHKLPSPTPHDGLTADEPDHHGAHSASASTASAVGHLATEGSYR